MASGGEEVSVGYVGFVGLFHLHAQEMQAILSVNGWK